LFELAIALTYNTAVLMIAVKCFIIAGPWLKEIKNFKVVKVLFAEVGLQDLALHDQTS